MTTNIRIIDCFLITIFSFNKVELELTLIGSHNKITEQGCIKILFDFIYLTVNI